METQVSNALVTGGAGFIGSHIVDVLVSNGCKVRVVDNLTTGKLANIAHLKDKVEFYEADIREAEAMVDLAKGCDVIFHQAAEVSVPKSVKNPVASAMINEIGTLNILEAARKNSARRVVLASSCAVYGNDPEMPKHEAMKPSPQSPYAVQKLNGEIYARLYSDLYGLDTVCLRYFNVFGPRQDPSSPYSGVISIFMTKAICDTAPVIYGDGNQSRDFVFVADVVRANLFAAGSSAASGEIYNIGTGMDSTINHLWKAICHLSRAKIAPRFAAPRPGDIIASRADISKAERVLAFSPSYAFEAGLEETFKWYKDAGMAPNKAPH